MGTPRRTTARSGLLAALVFCALHLPACDALYWRHRVKVEMFTPRRSGRAWLAVHGRTPVLHLFGTPAEQGRQYGTLMKPALHALSRYAAAVLSARRRAEFLDYARRHEPHLPQAIRAQLRATADTAQMDYLDLVALNVVPRLRCSALAVWGPRTEDGRMIVGRNGDYFGLGLDDRGSLLTVYHGGGEAVVLVTFLGMAGGFAGMNAEGVAFGNMLVFNASGRRADGLPVQLAMRLAAQRSRTARGMVDRLAAMRHVIPNNVMAADAEEALVAELAPGGACIRRGRGGLLAASNDFRKHPARTHGGRCGRYDALVRAADRHTGKMSVALMQRALLAARMPALNLQATVFEPRARRLHVSINRNPAAAGPYEAFDLAELLAAKPH